MAEKPAIQLIEVQGVKSIYDKASIEIQPLTILAGANSSGKSSIMQSLLMMKQTLDSEFETFGLILNGSNVRLSDTDQYFNTYTLREHWGLF